MKQIALTLLVVSYCIGLASAQVHSAKSDAKRLFPVATEIVLNPFGDDDSDGIVNRDDDCAETKENFNFFEDLDGCEDAAEYFDYFDFFGGVEAFENGELTRRGQMELARTVVKDWLEPYPETHWVIEVEAADGKQAALDRAEQIIAHIEAELGISDRLRPSGKEGIIDKFRLQLDTEKAEEMAKSKLEYEEKQAEEDVETTEPEEPAVKNALADDDGDGVLNRDDDCAETKENYNFFEDLDGCEDAAEYFDYFDFFSGIDAFENGELSSRAKRELARTVVKDWLEPYPETHWVIEVEAAEGKQAALDRAEQIIAHIEAELGISDRLRPSGKEGIIDKFRLQLDTEKAEEMAKSKLQEGQ